MSRLHWHRGVTSLEFTARFGGLLPVLIFTRHGVLIDVVQSLRAGAADFIREPCYFPEILARVERAATAAPACRRVAVGSLSLDVGSGVARIGSESVRLTEREARLLAVLLRCPAQPVSRAALLRAANIREVQPTIIESYMKQLRQKHPLLRRCLVTQYGRGYLFMPPDGNGEGEGKDQPSRS